jgi:hypothetical protein
MEIPGSHYKLTVTATLILINMVQNSALQSSGFGQIPAMGSYKQGEQPFSTILGTEID